MRRILARPEILLWAAAVCLPAARAQSPELKQILERLDRLEAENRQLTDEVRALRAEIAGKKQETGERIEIQEHRTEELAQTKVEASQRFPIRLTGMALFNAFLNSKQNGGVDYPTVAVAPGAGDAGATFRQTTIGLDYRGPQAFGGGQVHGSVFMDLFGGSSQALGQTMRLRTADITIDWKTRSLTAALDKPIFNPREPDSLAQVGISPLTGAGNLWLWIPQVKFEQRLALGESGSLRAQMGVVQTREQQPYQASAYVPEVERSRPGAEGRFEFTRRFGDRRIEIAPGFHYSVSHISDTSVTSNLFSIDWFANPLSKLEWTGVFFTGQNVSHLGTGALRQGVTVLGEGNAIPVHSRGGWTQLTWIATPRLSFHAFTGQHDDRNRDLMAGRVGKNLMYGANFFYRIAPNVIVSLESSQLRSVYIGNGTRLNNHYDLALAYLF